MTTYIFPGQGSQIPGMGKALFSEFPELMEKANRMLGYSVQALCVEEPCELLNKTEYTQPALYIVNALTYLKKAKETGKKPDYVAGHSLGEYDALFAAGVFDFETGLKLVQKRGELMSHARGGGMAAVVGLTIKQVKAILQQNNLTTVSIANHNSHKQVVISGPNDDINLARPLFEKSGATMFIPLKVSGAFHSPYMGSAQQKFADYLKQFTFSPPIIPVIANVSAKPYQENEIQTHLAHQITHPVEWTKSIEYLLQCGEKTFEEVGPGTVLTGLVRRIQKGE